MFAYFVLRWTRRAIRQLRGRGIIGTVAGAYLATRRFVYTLALRLPGVRDKVQLQIAEARIGMEQKLVPTGPGVVRHLGLPAEGWPADKVKAELVALSTMKHTMWEDGKVSGTVYHGGKDLLALQTEAYGMFTVSNPIHPDVFPGVRKMEAEIVAMVSDNPAWSLLIGVGPRALQRPRRRGRRHHQRGNGIHPHGMSERKK